MSRSATYFLAPDKIIPAIWLTKRTSPLADLAPQNFRQSAAHRFFCPIC
jgi:hypothetical protein